MTKQNKHKFAAIVLAAGKGTRMRSELPKVMHKLAGMPMIAHVLTALKPLAPEKVVVVVAPHMDIVKAVAAEAHPGCSFVVQEKQMGTGHAVRSAASALKGYKGTILVLYGDTPMLTSETLGLLLEKKVQHKAAIALGCMQLADPTGYGRLLMNKPPYVESIIECKDASAKEKKIPYVWGGVMAFDAAFLHEALANLKPSPVTGEYYLTTLIEMATKKKLKNVMVSMSLQEALGVNDRIQLAEAELILQTHYRRKAMEQGATLVDPASVYFSPDTKLGRDVVIYPQVVFGPGVSIADGVEIRSFSHIEGAHIERGATVGPFARLRPGSIIGEGAHVGNFVELKKTKLGKGAKANHLNYIGDSEVGANVIIGAGTITCNYDGFKKHKTTIGAGAFIGSNSSLIAPVTIGSGAIVGAGSVITENVGTDTLAITRAPQVNKSNKAREIRQRKQKKN